MRFASINLNNTSEVPYLITPISCYLIPILKLLKTHIGVEVWKDTAKPAIIYQAFNKLEKTKLHREVTNGSHRGYSKEKNEKLILKGNSRPQLIKILSK